MILLRRILPFIAPLFLAACIAGILLRPLEWRDWIWGVLALVFLSIAFMLKWRWTTAVFWGTLFPAIVCIGGGIALLFFLRNPLFQWVLSGFIVFVYGLYLETVFTYHYQTAKYATQSLPNISLIMNTFGGFSLATAGFALVLLTLTTIWVLTIGAFLFSIALMLHTFWSYQVGKGKRFSAALIGVCIITEMVWVLHFWPTVHFVNGAIVGLLIYFLPTIMQLELRGLLKRNIWIQYSVISLAALIVVILSAQWT